MYFFVAVPPLDFLISICEITTILLLRVLPYGQFSIAI
jgi:hypothetical protein